MGAGAGPTEVFLYKEWWNAGRLAELHVYPGAGTASESEPNVSPGVAGSSASRSGSGFRVC